MLEHRNGEKKKTKRRACARRNTENCLRHTKRLREKGEEGKKAVEITRTQVMIGLPQWCVPRRQGGNASKRPTQSKEEGMGMLGHCRWAYCKCGKGRQQNGIMQNGNVCNVQCVQGNVQWQVGDEVLQTPPQMSVNVWFCGGTTCCFSPAHPVPPTSKKHKQQKHVAENACSPCYVVPNAHVMSQKCWWGKGCKWGQEGAWCGVGWGRWGRQA